MKKGHLLIISVGIFGAIIILLTLFQLRLADNTLEFSIQDSISGSWVWNAKITFQGRVLKSFYQGDAGIKNLKFTNLQTGKWELIVSAPLYKTETIPVNIKNGKNSLKEPIQLTGLSIPDLHHFIVFETISNNEIISELRPVNTKGVSSGNHPCLDIRVFVMISEQMKDGLFTIDPESTDSYRGGLLFRGVADWIWNNGFDTIFRYTANIPMSGLNESSTSYGVIDYMIIVPDPEFMDSENMDNLSAKLSLITELDTIRTLLDSYGSKIRYFLTTSWNVEMEIL